MFIRSSDVSPRMFERDSIDMFSRTHWLTVPAVYLPLVGFLVARATWDGVSPLVTGVAFVTGVVIWTLTEYWLHRELFHWEPQTWWGPKFHFFAHGVHHQWHQDPYRLVMPISLSAPIALLFCGIFWGAGQLALLVGLPNTWWLGAFAGFVLGYITYDCMHYILHHWKPTFLWQKRLRAHHMKHHHNTPERKFGVSSTLWDRVFGTY